MHSATLTSMSPKKAPRSKHHAKRPRNLSRLGALRMLDPIAWEQEIKRAMAKADGRVPEAAAILDIGEHRLYVILRDPRFAAVKRAPAGNPHRLKERDSW